MKISTAKDEHTSVTVRMPTALSRRMRTAAARAEISASEYVRAAIEESLDADRQARKFVGGR